MPILQHELDKTRDEINSSPKHKNVHSQLPYGAAPTTVINNPEWWDGIQCLTPMDEDIITDIYNEYCGDPNLLRYISHEFEELADCVVKHLDIGEINFLNAWDVFNRMNRTIKDHWL